jgi:hypothetical protein
MAMFEMFEGERATAAPAPVSYESFDSVHELAALRFHELAHARGQAALFDVNVSTGEITFSEESF